MCVCVCVCVLPIFCPNNDNKEQAVAAAVRRFKLLQISRLPLLSLYSLYSAPSIPILHFQAVFDICRGGHGLAWVIRSTCLFKHSFCYTPLAGQVRQDPLLQKRRVHPNLMMGLGRYFVYGEFPELLRDVMCPTVREQ